jgi:flagellar assembly factor FliW
MWLQDADSVTPCFIVFKPRELFDNYTAAVSEEDIKALNLEADDELEFLAIAVIPEDYKKTTINLKSPIVINRNKKIAVQVILQQEYSLKFPIYQTIEEA